MFSLNSKTKASIQKSTGMNADDIITMSHDELDSNIERKIGKKLRLKFIRKRGISARGNVYIFLSRILRRDWLDKEIAKF